MIPVVLNGLGGPKGSNGPEVLSTHDVFNDPDSPVCPGGLSGPKGFVGPKDPEGVSGSDGLSGPGWS